MICWFECRDAHSWYSSAQHLFSARPIMDLFLLDVGRTRPKYQFIFVQSFTNVCELCHFLKQICVAERRRINACNLLKIKRALMLATITQTWAPSSHWSGTRSGPVPVKLTLEEGSQQEQTDSALNTLLTRYSEPRAPRLFKRIINADEETRNARI